MRVVGVHNASFVFGIAIILLAPLSLLLHGDRTSLWHFAGWIVPAMLAWGWIFWHRQRLSAWPAWILWLTFLLVRAPWFSTLPILSDDFYRFIWDGHSWLHGIHAFAFTPAQHPCRADMPFSALMPDLNSPHYFTIYPAPSQICFTIAAGSGSANLFFGVLVLRILWLGIEILGIRALRAMENRGDLQAGTTWGWMLFPVLIQEGVGNLHSELPAIAGLAMLVLGMFRKSSGLQLLGITLAIQFKLIPVLLLGCIFPHEPWSRKIQWWLLSLVVNGVLLFGLLYQPEYAQHFSQSVKLYAETFRFHAMPFELIHWLTGAGISLLGNVMRMVSLLVIAGLTVRVLRQQHQLPFGTMATILAVYWLGSPVIHPWYLLMPVFMQLFSNTKWTWGWLGVSIFSYLAYMSVPDWLSTTGVVIEYLGLGIVILIAILASGWKRR